MKTKIQKRLTIKARVKGAISRNKSGFPRLSVFRSNTQIYAQVIDDKQGKTLASFSSVGIDKCAKKEQAVKVGEGIAKKAIEAGVSAVVFDRNGYLYHGRVKELADAARNAGLKF